MGRDSYNTTPTRNRGISEGTAEFDREDESQLNELRDYLKNDGGEGKRNNRLEVAKSSTSTLNTIAKVHPKVSNNLSSRGGRKKKQPTKLSSSESDVEVFWAGFSILTRLNFEGYS